MTYILRFADALAIDPTYAGGKGANLARLMRAGFPVPTGFVVDPSAYRDATLAIAGRADALGTVAPDDHEALERASAAMIGALRGMAVAPALAGGVGSH